MNEPGLVGLGGASDIHQTRPGSMSEAPRTSPLRQTDQEQCKRRIWLHNRKRPAGEAGRFWGYYREERYVSLYMWIRGR